MIDLEKSNPEDKRRGSMDPWYHRRSCHDVMYYTQVRVLELVKSIEIRFYDRICLI